MTPAFRTLRRSRVLRSALAALALPGVVAFIVPALLAWGFDLARFNRIALAPLGAGIILLAWCVRAFHVAGEGTIAPWDPPRRLVAHGAYRVSRNPMYLAIALILLGWAIGFRSWTHLLYAIVVVIACHVRIVYWEEPWLRDRHPRDWSRYASQVPRWIFRSRRALAGTVVAVLVALPLTGLVYEAYAEGKAARDFPAPGTLIDVGGRQLHLVCIGEGTPVVFFEGSGFGVPSMSAATARERISAETQVCSYDRTGMGWSDPGPSVVTAGELARELAVLQDRARLPSPFVVVASSVGGLTAEMYARQYPERVAGLVFLDAATSDTLADVGPWFGLFRTAAPLTIAAARVGLFRLIDPFDIPTDTDQGLAAAMTYRGSAIGTVAAIARGAEQTAREFAEAPPLRADVPLVVLSASTPQLTSAPGFRRLSTWRSDNRVEAHQRLARRSTHGSWRMVPDSTHLIATSQPEVVAEAVLAMVKTLR